MQEKLEVLSPDSTQVGRPCNLCAAPLAPGDEVVECPRCHKFHHADCWKAKGGCATTGCPQVAEAVVGEKPKGDGPPPPYHYGTSPLADWLSWDLFYFLFSGQSRRIQPWEEPRLW